ncbi:unnamed protein product [Rotaria sp. Silwood1]|nr:unnamed protein product [Rotaria sp. Silwood1]CAF1059909.1 unnamed protein product [Rotaria sp. Silwood1]CAF3404193.1 unnamed protein product [Rotaria sp. Silwood1]CAF3426473.1 unnamed protein product [Rotaria sp. Silwood1]CAF3428661.1 unnamed protein product [Rotaria sp. Silwood1]
MTDGTEEHNTRDRKPSFSLTTVPEESEINSTIGALVITTPLVEPKAAVDPTNSSQYRPRRRSSISILQTLAQSHLLSTNDARKRNFLVGSSRQLSENAMSDMSSCFPNGRSLTIMMVTWNTGEAPNLYEQNFTPTVREEAQPKERMLSDMCDILLPTFIDYVSDLIIVCTQEMSATKNRTDWEVLLQEVIGQNHVLYHSIHFGTLSLCIFLQRNLIWFCTEPEEDVIKFRAVNALRTKGSVAITFNLFGTSFMIINSHFEAGEGTEGRSSRQLNFQHTLDKLTIPHEFVERTIVSSKSLVSLVNEETLQHSESTVSLETVRDRGIDITKACDCILWAGDMNFRIDMSHQEVVDHCNKKNYAEILLQDEFRILQQKTSNRHCQFKEANIDFPPTYKFDLRSFNDIYTKNRTPSYTDRILYRDKPDLQIKCTQYKSIESVKHSDHKPVVAHFRVKLKPGSHTGYPSYGKFNREVYQRGCEQREQHHSLGIGVENKRRRPPMSKSSVCVLQ